MSFDKKLSSQTLQNSKSFDFEGFASSTSEARQPKSITRHTDDLGTINRFRSFNNRRTRTFITQYSDNKLKITKVNSCLESGWELVSDFKNKIITNEVKAISNIERTFRRVRATIKDLVLENDFDFFVTFTVSPTSNCNRYELESVQQKLRELLKAYRRKYKDFSYLIVTEEHEDDAYHFHGFVSGIDNNDLIQFTENDFDISKGNKLPYQLINYIKNGIDVYHFNFFDNLGFNSLTKVRSREKCASYILKYITKDMVRQDGCKFYIRSRNLKTPLKYEIENIEFQPSFENDYCSVGFIDLNNCNSSDFEFLNKIVDK